MMYPTLKIAAGAGILYWLYRSNAKQKLASVVQQSQQNAVTNQVAQQAAQQAVQQVVQQAVQNAAFRQATQQAATQQAATQQAATQQGQSNPQIQSTSIALDNAGGYTTSPNTALDTNDVLDTSEALGTRNSLVTSDASEKIDALESLAPRKAGLTLVQSSASRTSEIKGPAVKAPAVKPRVVFGGDDDEATDDLGLLMKAKNTQSKVSVAKAVQPTAPATKALVTKLPTKSAVPAKSALRNPSSADNTSQPVMKDARDVLHQRELQRHLSKKFVQTLDLVQPAVIPFDYLAEEVKTLLLRGYAADYVTPKAIPEPGYSAAVAASTATGLPIGWTQMLIARGTPIDKVGQVAVDLISTLTDAAQAEYQQCPTCPMDLKRLRGTLMGRFAPLPEGAYMGAE